MTPLAKFIDSIQPAFLHGDQNALAKIAEKALVQTVRELYNVAIQGDFAAFAAIFADDIRLDISGPAQPAISGSWQGLHQVLEAIATNFSLLEDQRPVVESVTAQGDTVVVMFEETGRIKSTGSDYRMQCVQVFTFRDAKLAQIRQVQAFKS